MDAKTIWHHLMKRWVPVDSPEGQVMVAAHRIRSRAATRASAEAAKKMRAAKMALKTQETLEELAHNHGALVAALALKGQADLFTFISVICEFGENADPEGPRVTEDQREACEALQAWIETGDPKRAWLFLLLTPRDTLKSTLLQGVALWILVKWPESRILLYGEVHEQAKKRLAVIKRVIQHSQTFRDCYGDLDGTAKGLPWNEELITVATRTRVGIREASIETAGLDIVVNARHFDFIIPDDLHSDKNTKSKEQIDQVTGKVKLLMPLKSKGGRMIVAGVYWTDADVHQWLKAVKDAVVFERGAYQAPDYAPASGARYPHTLPLEELETKREVMDTDQFSCHFLLLPVSRASQKFRTEQFLVLPRPPAATYRVYLLADQAGDPTSSKADRRDSDYCGLAAWGVTAAQDLIGLDFLRARYDPTEAVEAALDLILRHRPYVIGVERAGVGNLAFYLREELRRRGMYANVVDLLPKGRSKYQRIIALEPLARRRKMFLAQEAVGKEIFLEEATRYPKGHDDVLDASAYLLDLLVEYGQPIPDTASEPWQASVRDLHPDSRAYWTGVHRAEGRPGDSWAKEFVA